jgi:hypothetical protein
LLGGRVPLLRDCFVSASAIQSIKALLIAQ